MGGDLDPETLKAQVGTIVTNLQSLELASRLFLSTSVGPIDTNLHIDKLKAGDTVAEGQMTNYESLREVIRDVNSQWAKLGIRARLDETVVETRDAFAHGRVFATNPAGPYRLVKFDRPKNRLVRVTLVLDLTEDWLKSEVTRTGDELLKLVRVTRELGLDCFPDD